MLHWLRAQGSRIAVATLVATASMGVVSVSPHEDDCRDAMCWAMAVEHVAAAHRIGAPPTGTDANSLHCLVCHLLRSFSFRPRTEAKVLSTPAAEAGTAIHIELFTAAASAPAAQPSLRSPPSSPIEA